MDRTITHHKFITAFLAVMVGVIMIFGGAVQSAFAADSVPVSIMTYENGDLDNAQEVYQGSCAWSGETDIKEAAARDFGNQIPANYTLGIAAVANQKEDRTIYRVKSIDVAKGSYELTDNTAYSIYEGDVLTLYYYPETISVPVYWCKTNANGALSELSDAEYKAVEGSKDKQTIIDVKDSKETVFAPVDSDIQVTYAIGSDGFFEGAKNDLDRVESTALFLKNGAYGLSYAAATTENPLDEAAGDGAGADEGKSSTEPEYETFSSGAPAIYIICQLEQDQLPQTAEPTEENDDGGSLIPFFMIVVLVVLLLYAAGRKFLF